MFPIKQFVVLIRAVWSILIDYTQFAGEQCSNMGAKTHHLKAIKADRKKNKSQTNKFPRKEECELNWPE